MKRAVVLLAVLTLLAGCTTQPRTPVAATYGTSPIYVVPNTTYTYTPTTIYVPNAAVAPSTTFVPSASPGYYYSSLADCQRANGLWYPATGICQTRP